MSCKAALAMAWSFGFSSTVFVESEVEVVTVVVVPTEEAVTPAAAASFCKSSCFMTGASSGLDQRDSLVLAW